MILKGSAILLLPLSFVGTNIFGAIPPESSNFGGFELSSMRKKEHIIRAAIQDMSDLLRVKKHSFLVHLRTPFAKRPARKCDWTT
jgi:hypothetical protein